MPQVAKPVVKVNGIERVEARPRKQAEFAELIAAIDVEEIGADEIVPGPQALGGGEHRIEVRWG
ncbi:hypothetical protein GCM10023325_10120 [Sphingomonas lutea]|nr:hypothetical protein [Sphingomonas lutea]